MTEQATTTDELAFIRPYGEQEKQILTAEAVEFLTELVTHFTPQRNKLLAARFSSSKILITELCLILFRNSFHSRYGLENSWYSRGLTRSSSRDNWPG